jgi:hypothetical protein
MIYMLEIYEPGSFDDVWVYFESTSPFGFMSAGDIINPGLWEGSKSPMFVLKVVSLEHILWEAEGQTKHKICVFTREVEGTRELRTRNAD